MEAVIRFFDKVAFVALVCMLFVVVASVLGRLVFDLSGGELQWVIPGSVELASYSLLMMVFASLPRAATHGLVSVELLIDKFPDCVKRGRCWLAVFRHHGGNDRSRRSLPGFGHSAVPVLWRPGGMLRCHCAYRTLARAAPATPCFPSRLTGR